MFPSFGIIEVVTVKNNLITILASMKEIQCPTCWMIKPASFEIGALYSACFFLKRFLISLSPLLRPLVVSVAKVFLLGCGFLAGTFAEKKGDNFKRRSMYVISFTVLPVLLTTPYARTIKPPTSLQSLIFSL